MHRGVAGFVSVFMYDTWRYYRWVHPWIL